MKKRVLSIMLSVVMVISLLPGLAHAGSEVVISTAEQLISLAYSTDKTDFVKNYRLSSDLDMSKAEDKRPMKAIGSYSGGSYDVAFCGTFDGAGFQIINLNTTGEALFGYVGQEGTIKNLTLKAASVHYQQNDSSKYPAALISRNLGQVENCMSIGSQVVSDYCSPAGGLIGTNFGVVSQSGVSGGSVTFAISRTGTSHGGFVGNQRGGRIEQCFSSAVVDAKKWAGGFVGKIEDGIISDCYALGEVRGTEEVGGFAGALMSPGILRNVYASNGIKAQSGGALVGGIGFSFGTAGRVEQGYYSQGTQKPQAAGNFVNEATWAKSEEEMRSSDFAEILSVLWAQDTEINGGYPYLNGVLPPTSEGIETEVTIQMMIAQYDKSKYEFVKLTGPFEVAVTGGSVTVGEVMEKAAEEEQLSYAFGTNENSGQIVTINGITPKSPDGWMFTINSNMPPVGVNSALVSEGDQILWFVGTPENGYSAPDWNVLAEGLSPEEVVSIETVEELLALSESPEKWNENYQLTGNLDCTGLAFSPIGNADAPFTGVFDGCGFEISGLTISLGKDSQNVGLFGVIRGAKIKNIVLNDARITGGSVIGALVGRADVDLEKERTSLISGCTVSGAVNAIGNSYIKQTDAGGLVGVNHAVSEYGKTFASAIDHCSAEVDVTADTGAADVSDAGHVGGLVGLNQGTVSRSKASGNVRGGNTTGGFVGTNYGGSIYHSSASGAVSGGYTTGGFVGSSGLYSLIENSYSTGDVRAIGNYGAYFGGFAGSVSGKVKNCISAGTLTPGWSYNGGFAGSFDGSVWSYREELRSLNNCYGNAVTADGNKIKALGNYIGGVHAPTDLAAAEIAVDRTTATEKIEEMLRRNEAENKLTAELQKYKANAAIPAVVKENSDITALVARLNANVSADGDIQISYAADGKAILAGETGYLLKQKTEDSNSSTTVALIFSDGDVSVEKEISVALFANQPEIDVDKLLRHIAEAYAQSGSDYWKIVTVGAYRDIVMDERVTNAFIEQAVESIEESETDTTLAMNIIALRSLGVDPTKITTQSGEKLNALQKLINAETTGNNGDAYRLLAYNQGNSVPEAEINSVIDRLLAAQINNKGWSNDGAKTIDPDSTGAVIWGLSGYYAKDSEVKNALDNGVEYLSTLMQADGNIKSSYEESNYGTNANTSAMAALGLAAMGIDISSDERFAQNAVSLLEGLLSFASDGGFVYEYGDKKTNELATKQAALAVMAAEKCGNVLDFSTMPQKEINLKTTGSETTSTGGGSLPVAKDTPKAPNMIDVKFTLVGDTAHGSENHDQYSIWLNEVDVKMPEQSTAADVINKVLADNGYLLKGLDNGYVSEVTSPDGIILGELTNGKNSGWLYLINGQAPTVGLKEYLVKNGDVIKLYYTDDWSYVGFSDVKIDDWFAEAVVYANENNLFKGFEDGAFRPNETMTRAMLVSVLGRHAKADLSFYQDSAFTDVQVGDWFGASVLWAAENGIVSGIGDGVFSPDARITREQLAAVLYRYAQFAGMNTEIGAAETRYSDMETVSEWATEAVMWAVETKLIQGVEEDVIAPQEGATRAQVAVILMRFITANVV